MPFCPRQLWSCGHQAPPSLAGHGAPEMPSLSRCHLSQQAPWRSHLWALEPKPEAHIRLAHLHRQQSPATCGETPSTWTGTILPVARKGISDCTRRVNGSIKTYSFLKMHLFTTAWGRQATFVVYREFRLFSPPSLPLPSTIFNQTSYPETNLIYCD